MAMVMYRCGICEKTYDPPTRPRLCCPACYAKLTSAYTEFDPVGHDERVRCLHCGKTTVENASGDRVWSCGCWRHDVGFYDEGLCKPARIQKQAECIAKQDCTIEAQREALMKVQRLVVAHEEPPSGVLNHIWFAAQGMLVFIEREE